MPSFFIASHKGCCEFLNSFSGHMITAPEKARRGASVHSTNLRLVSIERSLFFRRKQAISVIPSMTFLLCAALFNHKLYRMSSSIIGSRPWMTFRSVLLYWIPSGFNVCWHSRRGGVGLTCVPREVVLPFLLVACGTLAFYCCQVHLPVFLSLSADLCCIVFI